MARRKSRSGRVHKALWGTKLAEKLTFEPSKRLLVKDKKENRTHFSPNLVPYGPSDAATPRPQSDPARA